MILVPFGLCIYKCFARKNKKGKIRMNKKAKFIMKEAKDTVMWSGVFRPQIQTFLATVDIFFYQVKHIMKLEQSSYTGLLTQGLTLVMLPSFSYFFLKRNKKKLKTDSFKIRYGTLYESLDVRKPTAYMFITIFCLRRILIGFSNIFWQGSAIGSIFPYIYSS